MPDFTRWAWTLWLLGIAFTVLTASVSAYSNDDCGKLPGHPEYGITFSGTVAGPQTAACPSSMLGSWVLIPDIGWRHCEDTGGAIEAGWNGLPCIDVWVKTTGDAKRWGRRTSGILIQREE